ncbi:MAG: hypothetical protein ACK5Z1_05330, partial [Gemmatimonadota bacterium]
MNPESPSRERAERLARAHACAKCGEYSWKRLRLRAATPPEQEALNAVWHAELGCGVCGLHQEIVIDHE